MTINRTITTTQRVNFYGTDRFSRYFHPSERMDEMWSFDMIETDVLDDDGELLDTITESEEFEKLEVAIREHARHLLQKWPDQPGIDAKVVDSDSRYSFSREEFEQEVARG